MTDFASTQLPSAATAFAPDGSEYRALLRLAGGSFAHFRLPAGACARAVAHRSVEEIWYVLDGRGALWRAQGGREEVVELVPGVCATIPLGTAFQFRAAPDAALAVLVVTLPPWPGGDEAVPVAGPWPADPG